MKIRFPKKLVYDIHAKLHKIIYGQKELEKGHKPDWYDWYCGYFIKELREIKDSVKKIQTQVNYLQYELEENRIIKENDAKTENCGGDGEHE